MDSFKKLNPTLNGKAFNPAFVCDSATWIKAYQGGCIVNTIRPVFILNGNPFCLHRTRDTATIDNNRKVSIPTCRKEWPGYQGHCDEFPFASTQEGAKSITYDCSVKVIPATDNCSSGSRTSVFYQRHRIRDTYSFWVDIIPKGQTAPASGAPGTVVYDPLPEELPQLDHQTCTVDGLGANIIGPIPPAR
ncbi:NucA/NucB deoxyribonuclease domain-containing protein [Herbidospora cretacea]|uniref:NucA/NucB deoxyribonuclease domain-containing protein n=1 Tax=Herbidospora cretacea TaxID=28444 RepID=UPI0005540DD4|nr:NucA/NucB deoxyribonuclease domain-containing protein [Herbidospora cretacea]